jgi:hypothetical protein
MNPIVIAGSGGSGTRAAVWFLIAIGVQMGKYLNRSADALAFVDTPDALINPSENPCSLDLDHFDGASREIDGKAVRILIPAMPVVGGVAFFGLLPAGRGQRGRPAIMALIDRQYLARPYYGSRRMTAWLATQGHVVNRKRVQRLMGLVAIYQRPNTSKPAAGARSIRTGSAGLRSSGSIRSGARILPTSQWPKASSTSWWYGPVSRAVLTWRLSTRLVGITD